MAKNRFRTLGLFGALALILSHPVLAEETATDGPSELIHLAPVIAEGTAAELLKFDPIVPATRGKIQGRVSTGNIAKELANDLPFHSNSNMKPGNEVGFIGIGKGAEETDVNLLGIPINRPQGGGADLATFPQYFWSGYSYQLGPSLGAFDPRGVGGSLSLRLWTQEALGTESQRATAYHSTRRIQQFSYGRSGERYAALIGMTTDSVVGPALSFSAVPVDRGSFKVTTHLLYSDTDAKGFISERSGSTTSSQRTFRLIPVVQIDKKFANSLLKTAFFEDFTFVRYEDSASPSDKQIKKVYQFGNESAYLFGNTRLGFGVRSVRYERTSSLDVGNYPSEQILNVQASHAFRSATSERSNLIIEPTLGGYAVTRNGFHPTGSVGVRHETQFEPGKFGQFLRAGFTRRFPSLLDRYYQIRFQVPGPGGPLLLGYANPGLTPENVRSVETGVDYASRSYRYQLTVFGRDYKHARYTRQFIVQPFPTIIGYQVVNAGDAYVFGATESNDWKVSSAVDLGTRVTHQRSMIKDLKAAFPYSPMWVGILKGDFHQVDNRYGLEVVYKLASDYVAYSETSGGPAKLPGYAYLDLFARAQVYEGVHVILGVENVFDRPIQFRITSPDEGRIYSIAANATF